MRPPKLVTKSPGGGAAQRLVGDRLDGGEGVLDAVVQLLEEQALELRRLLPLGDVVGDLGGADDPAGLVASGETVTEMSSRRPSLATRTVSKWSIRSPRLILAEDVVLFGEELGRDEAGDGLADHLVGAIAEGAGSAAVPRGHPAVEVLADDGVVGPFDDGGEPGRLHLLLLLVEIHEEGDRADDGAGLVAEKGRLGDEGDTGSIRPFEHHGSAANRWPSLTVCAIGLSSWAIGRPSSQRGATNHAMAAGLGASAPEIRRGSVVEGDAAVGVGRIDCNRKASRN